MCVMVVWGWNLDSLDFSIPNDNDSKMKNSVLCFYYFRISRPKFILPPAVIW